MNLDSTLRGNDRVASIAAGIGVAAYAALGDFDSAWIRGALVIVGVMLAVGGARGT